MRFYFKWCLERDLVRADEVTLPILESYARHLFRFRKPNGKPLSNSFFDTALLGLTELFRSHHILYNPASKLERPKENDAEE